MNAPRGARLSNEQKRSWLKLIRTPNVGPSTFRQLLNRYGSAEAALEALPDLLLRGGKRQPPRIPSDADLDSELERLTKGGARLVALGEPDYPRLLQHIHAAPPLLTIWGDSLATQPAIAIVGARNASAAGKKLTAQIAAELGQAGYVIVSGLARGIDAAAHESSLATGTIAVLAGGLDHVYPEENKPLARKIVDGGGAILTEMPLGAEPRAQDFPRRNRLVSGMAEAVIVVEAAKRSGSLITARLALEQNREVFAVPGSPLDPRAGGTNHLIQQGATLITSAEDVLEALRNDPHRHARLLETGNETEAIAWPSVDEEPSSTDFDRVREALSPTPMPFDDLASSAGVPLPVLHAVLLEMELAGEIERSAGNLVALS
ncbi:MAG: DNA-processing protein DprA [Hyphomicrobiaceae bacterium]|nr:DNA-processing protein DprA [Hyphomicrobiaceae bacterium]MCC0023602.1 DNA-protecting protein DprA [Hyphomicrobiaceae bacterium]